ncbi:uncharacterized protein BDZ99DRAFT_495383 [Mytilinidion resinicola]|uniref:Uncharacterized protein n=1 Tax=Mytilinidion resinicola TaxID=574789 RepID=A0A6A6YY49_9PEZI|nr:uncharacterized protein BDZ99DRAFT_495383 [Mytilinidion resinicola]KAF2813751.1 hypothetical protein BDZ99DRAFT_495383 [Mytilinidion resinicola]
MPRILTVVSDESESLERFVGREREAVQLKSRRPRTQVATTSVSVALHPSISVTRGNRGVGAPPPPPFIGYIYGPYASSNQHRTASSQPETRADTTGELEADRGVHALDALSGHAAIFRDETAGSNLDREHLNMIDNRASRHYHTTLPRREGDTVPTSSSFQYDRAHEHIIETRTGDVTPPPPRPKRTYRMSRHRRVKKGSLRTGVSESPFDQPNSTNYSRISEPL